MPELAEVETIKQDLSSLLPEQTITNAKIYWDDVLENTTKTQFLSSMENSTIESVSRRGKFLIITFDDDACFLIHLRMSGRLLIDQQEPEETEHLSLSLSLSNGMHLLFLDVRRFGRVFFFASVEDKDVYFKEIALGVEPLDESFSIDVFHKILKSSAQNVKTFLLDQQNIAGIGNIYANEILWEARINPEKNVNKLKEKEQLALFYSIKLILIKAIEKRGTTISDFHDVLGVAGEFQHFLAVYGKEGDICLRCNEEMIKKQKQSERSTYFCPNCQK